MKDSKKTKEQLIEEVNLLTARISDLENDKKKFEIVASNTSDSIAITTFDLKAKYLYVSPSVKSSLGYEPSDLLGKSFFDFIHPDDKNVLYPLVKKYIKSVVTKLIKVGDEKISESIEYRFKNKSGSWHYLQSTVNFIGKDLLAITRDISERKKTEIKLQQSETRFKCLYESLGDAVYVTKIGGENIGQILEVNLAAIKQTGYTRDELLQMNIVKDLYVLGSADIDTSDWERKLSNGERVSAIEKKKRKDGTEYWTEIIVTPIEYKGEISALSINHDITERIQSEMTLRESEEKFRTLAETISSAIMMYQNNKWVYSNNAATVITGYTQNELLKMNFWEIVHPEYVDKVKNIGNKRQANKPTLQNHEFKILTKSGEEKWVWLSGATTIYKNQPAGIITVHDVSSHKQAEEALLESEKKYRNLFTSANDSIFLIKDYKFISCNPRTLELFACKEEDIIGQTPIEFSPEYQPDGIATIDKTELKINAALEGKPQFFEWLHKRFDGSLFHAEVSLNKILLSDGEYIQAMVRDIDDRKRAEKIQKVLYNISFAVNLTENLEELISVIRKELGTLIDTTNFYVAIYDEKTDTILLPYIVDQKDTYTSFPAGNTYTAQVIKNKKSYLINNENVEEFESNGKVEAVGTFSEIWLGVPMIIDGKVMGAIVVQSYENENAYNSKDMELLEFVSNTVGISIERKRAEHNLKQALEKATESDRLKSTFLASMSHELRTPLNAIIGFSDIIDEELPLDDILDFAKTINSSGNHLLSIVNDLFDITLIESGQSNIKKEVLDLRSILNEVNEIINVEQYKTNKSHIDLSLKVPVETKGLKINTDPSKLKQILINLLKNALKFTNKGSVKYGYNIESKDDNPVIKFFVEDTGIGVPKSKQDLIFDVFRQAEESYTKTHGGTGIGLTISKKLVKLLGGEIWLESESEDLAADKAGGTVFHFTLPYEEIILESDKSVIQKIENEKTTELNDSKKKTILIVEDDKSSYEYLKVILAKFDSNIIWAKNGKIAVENCKEMTEIDLVLMDINMPVMNGYEATKQIKNFKPDLPIIAQTAYAIIGDRQLSLDAGCDDYISKPIKREKLLKIIKQYLA